MGKTTGEKYLMGLGKRIRMNRLFARPSGRMFAVAVDHFFAYQKEMPAGLSDMPATLQAIVAGGPDAVTMQKGTAVGCWERFGGKVPMILQSFLGRIDGDVDDLIALPEDAVRLGADAYATCALVRGRSEVAHLARVANLVRQASAWDLPVVLHIYPRHFAADGKVSVSYTPEDVAWAIRCAFEMGVDVIKVPYTGDPTTYRQAIGSCPVAVVAAGGPKAETVEAALAMAAGVVASGAKGMTVGRNVWGFPQVTRIVKAFNAVIHEGVAPAAAMRLAGV
ncbi:MAG: class I fructose-bisphosphate aldolase [Bacillota bacterium]